MRLLWLRLRAALGDHKARIALNRSAGARKAAVTRKRNAEDTRIAEDIARNETARIFKSDPTP